MYCPSSENKGADQLRGYRGADLRLCFRLCRLLVFPMRGLIYTRIANIWLHLSATLLHKSEKKKEKNICKDAAWYLWDLSETLHIGLDFAGCGSSEPRHVKTRLMPMRKQRRRSADQCLCFRTRIVLFLFFLNPKCLASSHLL